MPQWPGLILGDAQNGKLRYAKKWHRWLLFRKHDILLKDFLATGQPTYANVSKISLQQCQRSNYLKQFVTVHVAQTSTGRIQEGPRSRPQASPGPSRSSSTWLRFTSRSSPRLQIQLYTEDGTDVIQRPIHVEPFPENSLQVTDLRENFRHKLRRTSGVNERDQE